MTATDDPSGALTAQAAHEAGAVQEIVRLERRGCVVQFTRRVGDYVEIVHSEPVVETRDGAA